MGFIARMFAGTLRLVLRETMHEIVTPQFEELKAQIRDVRGDVQDLKRSHQRFEDRMDGMDGRIDQLAQQQQRMVEQVAGLKASVDVSTTLVHRIDRLEDKVFG